MYPSSYENINQRVTEKYLNYSDGFFIEVGAADGFTQSNTWYLEKYKNWKGILIEPNIDAYNKCVFARQNSKVFNCALIDHACKETEIEMYHRRWYNGDPGLTSSAHDSSVNNIEEWKAYTFSFKISARTLDSILEESNITSIDFVSIDVEGYELQVLKGFSLEKYLPKFLLIEWFNDISEIENYIKDTHIIEEKMSKHDYLFKLRN